jgi:hypothetical protein
MRTIKIGFAAMLCILLLGQHVVAQTSLKMSLLGNYGKGEGDSKSVFAAGSLVFYGLGSKMQIASFSNPSAPVKIASVEVSEVIEFLVRTSINSNQYIVASGGSKLWLINVQDPAKPSLVSSTTVGTGVTCEGLATSGTYAYIAAGSGGFKIYSISNPTAPSLVATVDSSVYCESVVISAPYAYVAANTTSNYQGKSFIYDISNPAAPVYKSTIMGYGGYHQYMSVRGGYAYICDYNAGLQVINVSDVTKPVNVANIPSGYRTASIVFDGNYGYAAVGDSGMTVYNLTNPAAPTVAGRIVTTGRAAFVSYGSVTVSGSPVGHIFVSNRNPVSGLTAINVSNPASPTTSAFLSANQAASGIAYSPFYSNGKVYVAYGNSGLRIVDVSNAAGPSLLSTIPLGGDSRAVVVSGTTAFIAARDSGVFVVDAANPASPVKLATIKTPRARGVAVNGNYVYVAASDSGLGIINITNPKSPVLVGYLHPGGQYGENVAVAGNVIGLTDYNKILFFDATSPGAPVGKGVTSTFKTGNEGFAIAGSYAYVPDGDSMKVFNIANLQAPTQIAKIFTGGYGYTAAVAGNYCYVASEGTGVRTINVSNPSSPAEVGYYDGVPQSRGVAANGPYVYVAEKADGLTIYSNDLATSVEELDLGIPREFSLDQNFPNPFNPSTQIRFSVPSKGMVTLKVFDMLGRQVAVVVNQVMEAGVYTAKFDAKNLASGTYVYTLTAGTTQLSNKMIVLK